MTKMTNLMEVLKRITIYIACNDTCTITRNSFNDIFCFAFWMF